MKTYFLIAFLLSNIYGIAQTKIKALKVTYEQESNGKTISPQSRILLFTSKENALLTNEENFAALKKNYPESVKYVSFTDHRLYSQTFFNDKDGYITVDSLSLEKQQFETTDETKVILGYLCHKVKTSINSNIIELWYTKDLDFKGAPTTLGQNLGLVLEMTRNGNYTIIAKKIERIKNMDRHLLLPDPTAISMDLISYNDKIWKSKFKSIPVFKNEVISFNEANKSNDSIYKFANGTVIVRKIKFPKLKKHDLIFLDLEEQSNGDAYDRTGSVFIIPQTKKQSFFDGLTNGVNVLPIYQNGNGKNYQGIVATDDYEPLVELMRFFTPFGVHHFNQFRLKDKIWSDAAYYRQDISELHSLLDNEEVYIGTFIGNYDKGGHKISMNITIHDSENSMFHDTKAIPVFNTTNIMEMGGQEYSTLFDVEKGLEVTFRLKEPLKKARLRYISTGHGGWENGDEFLPKSNTISLNGKQMMRFIPWRQDCGSYRLMNPVSGNFENGLSSSDYSRSNWCPGTVTNPIMIELGDLEAGEHTIQIQIPQGQNEGGSFSSWNVSGIIIGE